MSTDQVESFIYPGSSLYYSLLPLDAKQRQAAEVLLAYYRCLQKVLFDCSDMGVAKTKMLWWSDETQRLINGNAQHPVASALAELLDTNIVDAPLLTAWSDSFFERLQLTRLQHENDLQRYAAPTRYLIHAISRLSGNHEWRDEEAILARLLQMVDSLRHLRRYCVIERLPLPESLLQQYGISSQQLLSLQHSDELAMFINLHRAEMAAILRALKPVLKPLYLPSLIYADCQLATLACYETDSVFAKAHRLTPLHKWWRQLKMRW